MEPISNDDTPTVVMPPRSRTEVIASHLRDEIICARLKAGQKLNLDNLARKYGVSRMPVRDALKLLESEGLVRIYPYRGIEVSALSVEDIEELFGLREALENVAATRAIDRLDEAQLDRMEALLQEMDTIESDGERWLELNAEFHGVLYEASGWPRLVEMITKLRANMERYVRVYLRQLGRARPQAQHWALLEACRSRDAGAARSVLAEHLRDTSEALQHSLARGNGTAPTSSFKREGGTN